MEEIIALLALAMGKPNEEITASLEKDGVMPEGQALVDSAKGLLTKHISDVKKEQHKRGSRETHAKYRSEIKSRWADAPSDVTDDLEFFKEFLETKEGSADPAGMSKEDLVKNPVVKSLITEQVQRQKEQYAKLQDELHKTREQYETETAKILAQTQLQAVVNETKVILGEDDQTRQRRLKTLETLIFNGRKMKAEGGKLVFLDANGDPETDDAGNPITLKNLVLQEGAVFGFHKQDPGKAGAGAGSGNGKEGGSAKMKFTTKEDFQKYLEQNAHDAEKITEGWAAYAESPPEA